MEIKHNKKGKYLTNIPQGANSQKNPKANSPPISQLISQLTLTLIYMRNRNTKQRYQLPNLIKQRSQLPRATTTTISLVDHYYQISFHLTT